MPNTLAHLFINGITTRTVIRKADLLWIYLGAILPDVPWIFQRAARAIIPGLNPYDLRLYCIVLASLFFTLLISAAIAILTKNSNRVFGILSLGVLIHLLLDSIEIKWANGVHLFAPFNWKLFNTGFFWPESIPITILTLLGIGYVIYYWRDSISTHLNLYINFKNLLTFSILIAFYIILPFFFVNAVESVDNHYIKTLRNYEQRTGKYIELDRAYAQMSNGKPEVITFADEIIEISNKGFSQNGPISIQGEFVANKKIKLSNYHMHSEIRNNASYIGLLLVGLLLILSLRKEYSEKKVVEETITSKKIRD